MVAPQKLPAAGRRLRNIFLVQPPISGGPTDVTPPLGILSLAAVLEREDAGRAVRIVDLNLLSKTGGIDPTRSLRTQLVRQLPRERGEVDLVGVTTWSYNFDVTMEFIEEVKKRHPQAPIVLGGPHATFVDEEVLGTFGAVDYVLRDEGDWTFPRLLRALEGGRDEDLAEVPGLTWRRGGDVVRNPSGGVVDDLDALPFPAYHLIDPAQYVACSPVLVVEAGRGCPYNCNFCSTTNMFQRRYRVKSPARLVDEIEWAMGVTGSNRFELLHDNLVANKEYVLALCREIRRRNIDVDWSCTSRTDNITEPVAQEMFLAGCVQVFFGVESLAEERQRWTGKRLKPAAIRAAVELTARQHIRPTVGIIVGFPEETEAELDATVGAAFRWATEPGIEADVSTATLRYYPGADLFRHASELRWDPLAAADTAAISGQKLRPKWRGLTNLFPLQAIHTPPDETRTNLFRTHAVHTLLRAAPLTVRACFERLGLGPRALLERLAAARSYTFLEDPFDTDRIWNEVVPGLGAVLEAEELPAAQELLRWEAPFWETRAVVDRLDHVEHVVHPKRFDQEELLAWARGQRDRAPREVSGFSIFAARAGRDVFVSATRDPQALLAAFRRRLPGAGVVRPAL